VIILADADSDGLHIATLLSALFLRHFRAGARRPRVRGDAAAVPRRRGQAGVLRAGRRGKAPLLEKIEREKIKGAVTSPASRAWAR
jgi:topoisomerase-4 subunit B